MPHRKKLIALAVSGCLSLSGCFSSSSSSDGSNDSSEGLPPIELSGVTTGIFIDSAVAGLEYETSSGYEGITDQDGTFAFEPGDTVTFKVGEIRLGSVSVDDNGTVITPVELFEDVDLEDQRVVRIARFLQSIDDDGFPGNGIEITDEVRENAKDRQPVSLDQDLDEEDLKDLVSELGKNNRVEAKLVDGEQAKAHLSNSIGVISPVTSCDDPATRNLQSSDIQNTTFAWIGLYGDGLFILDGESNLEDIANDTSNGSTSFFEGTWELEDNGSTLVMDEDGQDKDDVFSACKADNAILVGTSEDGYSRAAEVRSVTKDDVTGNYRLEIEGERIGTLRITENGTGLEAELISSESSETGKAEIDANGLLTVTDIGGRDDATAYFLKGAVNPKAVYLEGEASDTGRIGNIQAIGPITGAAETTFSNRVLTDWMEDEQLSILWFDRETEGRFVEFANDHNGGNQAKARHGDWSWTSEGPELNFDDGENDNDTDSQVEETSTQILVDNEPLFSKVARISERGVVGNYDIHIPTENSSERGIQLQEGGDCIYDVGGDDSALECSWTIVDRNRIEASLDNIDGVKMYAWKLADRSDAFSFLHIDPQFTDPEPGRMTPQ